MSSPDGRTFLSLKKKIYNYGEQALDPSRRQSRTGCMQSLAFFLKLKHFPMRGLEKERYQSRKPSGQEKTTFPPSR